MTPVIQTSHSCSCRTLPTRRSSRLPTGSCDFIMLRSADRKLPQTSALQRGVWWNPPPPLAPPTLLDFCGLQQKVILSHLPSLHTEKKNPQPSRKPPPGANKRPPPRGPARACTCQALPPAAARLLASSPAADSPGILPLLLPLWVETCRSWLPRSEAERAGSAWHTCGLRA